MNRSVCWIVVFAVTMIVGGTAFAQLGKFPGQVTKAYGTPTKEGQYNGSFYQSYEKDGKTIKVYFRNNKSYKVEIFKTVNQGGIVKYEPLTSKDVDNFLRQYSKGKVWQEQVRIKESVESWKRWDNKAVAQYNTTSNILTIQVADGSSHDDSYGADNDALGFQWSILPNVMIPEGKTVHGYKLGFPMSNGYSSVRGMDTAVFCSLSPRVKGFKTALVCVSERVNGVQAAVVNISHDSYEGVQFGLVNVVGAESRSAKVEGAQFGLVNYARDMDGMQFGLINFISYGPMKFLPFFNFKFKEEN